MATFWFWCDDSKNSAWPGCMLFIYVRNCFYRTTLGFTCMVSEWSIAQRASVYAVVFLYKRPLIGPNWININLDLLRDIFRHLDWQRTLRNWNSHWTLLWTLHEQKMSSASAACSSLGEIVRKIEIFHPIRVYPCSCLQILLGHNWAEQFWWYQTH